MSKLLPRIQDMMDKSGEEFFGGREGLEWLSEMFMTHYQKNYPEPYFYCTYDGNVNIEWDNFDFVIEVNPRTRTAIVHFDKYMGD